MAAPIAPLVLGRISPACQKFKGNNIQTIHLRDADNEYNTYMHEGLPPGPIANPGRASLMAVMKPDGSPYLYFVATSAGGVQLFLDHLGRTRGRRGQVPARRQARCRASRARASGAP